MNYYSLSDSTVKITLSDEDMKEYSLRPENIMLNTSETKRIFAQLLKKLGIFHGCSAERLFLEAFPRADGGCVLYVSGLYPDYTKEQHPDNSGKCRLMCGTKDLDTLVRLCRGLKAMGADKDCCVYRSNCRYFIITETENESVSKIRHFLSEYGNVTRDLSRICALKEYGEPVCMNNACEILSQLY